MSKSAIEWTDETWNPTTGCTKVSAGCKHCYAERMSKRQLAMGREKYDGVVSLGSGRTGIGLELSADYLALARQQTAQLGLCFSEGGA